MLRMSPFSAGTVTISPCTSNTARAPEGEMLALRIRLASSFSKCGCSSASCDETRISTFFDRPDARSSTNSDPKCS